MFSLFGKKSKTDALQQKYQMLLKEAYEFSKVSRLKSDKKYVEAQRILEELGSLLNPPKDNTPPKA